MVFQKTMNKYKVKEQVYDPRIHTKETRNHTKSGLLRVISLFRFVPFRGSFRYSDPDQVAGEL